MGQTSRNNIQRAAIRHYSGWNVPFPGSIRVLKRGEYFRVDASVAGDAPKDLIRIYEYGQARKARTKRWPGYIAKVGVKAYPTESITEHLLTRVGQLLGVQMADSHLMWVRGQIRFMSRYFLSGNENLIHGAEIFTAHLGDRAFVEAVEKVGESRSLFTFQFIEEALHSQFPQDAPQILADIVKLLAFDAIVGNNDRHYINWGVVRDASGKRPARLSPIYDTARALFWNTKESELARMQGPQLNISVNSYISHSRTKTGWDGAEIRDHFELINRIYQSRPEYRPVLLQFSRVELQRPLREVLDLEFDRLISPQRVNIVLSCIVERQRRFTAACQ